ncbi:NADH-quinone oxidoreductase subunit L [Skermania sp. ID1734]|uniref:NADH-quinone oxidoreductase subunit 5 family protein n=1 Tax=Skermania sp. ID1734 TaxID=2597516 RepID=UPI00117BE27D|nr:proton-conducting transporter membrane subunit [Skermania sp. ID1734]TSD93777.1 NADH-quinone oxidoreductase subunit L [Skermania sp. ID1734]
MLWSLIAVPAIVGGTLLLAGRRADRCAAGIALGAAAATLALSIVNAAQRPTVSAPFLAGVAVVLRVDGLSVVMIVTVAVVVVAVLVFAAGDLGRDAARARFFGLMLIFAAAMLATVTAATLVELLMAWELMGAASYALIGFRWADADRAASGLAAFLTTRTGDVGLYLAAGAAVAGGAGSLRLVDLPGLEGRWRDVAAAGIVVAALGKSAQLPFSFWLSRAMAGPSPVSALLHSATMVAAGAYLLLRLQPVLAATDWAATLVAWVGVATAVALGAVAVCQHDLKQLLAASTCSQVGYMVLAAGVGDVAGGTGQLVAHAATKSLLFLAAGAWLTALGTKNLSSLRGAARRYPVVGWTFSVGALSLAGVPPLSLWVSKDGVLAAAAQQSQPLYVIGFAAAVLGAVYAGRALVLVWLPEASDAASGFDVEEKGTRRVKARQWLPLVALAASAAGLGALALPAVHFSVVGGAAATGATRGELALSGLVAVAAVAVTAVVVRRWGDVPSVSVSVLAGWLGLQHGVRILIVAPTLRTAAALARFDDAVLDRGVWALAQEGITAARWTARVEPVIDGLVIAVAAGARDLAGWARRPQTGQVHQYYAQAVVVMVVLAVLVVVLT